MAVEDAIELCGDRRGKSVNLIFKYATGLSDNLKA